MKKNIFYLFLLLFLAACAVKKPEKRARFMKGFKTQYNTLFNAQDALNTEFKERTKAHKDNFYAPYIDILTYEEQPLGSDIGKAAAFTNVPSSPSPMNVGKSGAPTPPGRISGYSGPGSMDLGNAPTPPSNSAPSNESKGASALEIAEAKALKAIDKFSVMRDGEEKNSKIFDAYITLVQARIYQGKNLLALDALNKVFQNMKDDKRLPLAKIYQGLAFAKMKDYARANKIFADLKNENIKKDYQKLLSIYYAESLLESGKKDAAVDELENAFQVNNNRSLKSRIAFLRGQILESQDKGALARESFVSAYKYANDFEFEVKSQIEIAKTYNSKDDYSGAKKYLENISKKGTYTSRKNEFYYALGLMANKAGKKQEAMDYFHKSLKEKISDPQIRGLNYYEIGRAHLENEDYITAGVYYDSALTVMTYEPTKIMITNQNENIKNIAKNFYLIKKNDSILTLAKMSDPERIAYFEKHIAKIKAKEEAEEKARIREEKSKGFDSGDYDANSVFGTKSAVFQDLSGGASKSFYFSNSNTVSKGSTEFKQIWGNRALADNWRFSSTMATIEDTKNEALGIASTANPRRFESSFYIEKIPRDQLKLDELKKQRDTASLGLGIMYDDYFGDTPLATKTLYNLVDNKPEEKVMLQALYEIFSMNYENNPSASERAKQILLNDYPYTSYAEFARNPRNKNFVKSAPEVENAYRTAFALYESERFEESRAIIEKTLQQYKNDALVPKFTLLNAFIAGKTAGKEIMILQLEQIVLNYEKTPEGEKAKEMLNWLRSDLQLQMTDDKGNVLNKNNQAPTQPPNQNFPVENLDKKKRLEGKNNQTEIPTQNQSANPTAPPTLPKQPKNK